MGSLTMLAGGSCDGMVTFVEVRGTRNLEGRWLSNLRPTAVPIDSLGRFAKIGGGRHSL